MGRAHRARPLGRLAAECHREYVLEGPLTRHLVADDVRTLMIQSLFVYGAVPLCEDNHNGYPQGDLKVCVCLTCRQAGPK